MLRRKRKSIATPEPASACSDLALIDIEGDGYNYLEWRDGPIEAGLMVYAAGFPSDPDGGAEVPRPFRIIDGLIITEEGDGEHAWASIDRVIEHSATTRGGSSGGPLVDESAKLVGVNYGGIDDLLGEPTERNFAIARDEAQGIISGLRNGDVESLGVNGSAVGPDDPFAPETIAVSSVKTGSPADKVGLRGITEIEEHNHLIQDFIVSIQGTDVAREGTMQEYCDILRVNDPTAPLDIEVIRVTVDLETNEVLGAINLAGTLNQSKLREEAGMQHAGEEEHEGH